MGEPGGGVQAVSAFLGEAPASGDPGKIALPGHLDLQAVSVLELDPESLSG